MIVASETTIPCQEKRDSGVTSKAYEPENSTLIVKAELRKLNLYPVKRAADDYWKPDFDQGSDVGFQYSDGPSTLIRKNIQLSLGK